jgi:hypothetical protein
MPGKIIAHAATRRDAAVGDQADGDRVLAVATE